MLIRIPLTAISLLLCSFTVVSQSADKVLRVSTDKVFEGCVERGLCGDELAVGLESAKLSARYMHGWRTRNAKTSLGADVPAAAISATQQRMDATISIEDLTVDIEVVSVKDNEAIVLAHQKFARLLRQPNNSTRTRITSVTHRETWERTAARWRQKGFVEENQKAAWADEIKN